MQNLAINGQPSEQTLSAPLQALSDFYAAFNARDVQASMANWWDSPEAAMSNPIGGIRRGHNEIMAGYTLIMTGPARVYVEFYDFVQQQSEHFFYVAGRERGYFEHGDTRIDLQIRTSRIYRYIDQQWQQVHHHGSIDDAALLQQYQHAIHHLKETTS